MTADEAAEPIAALNFGGFREANALYIVEAVNAHAELARDKARLDWLEQHYAHTNERGFNAFLLSCAPAGIRAATDGAMAMQPQPARKD